MLVDFPVKGEFLSRNYGNVWASWLAESNNDGK